MTKEIEAVQQNKDGSTDIYFGPQAPEGSRPGFSTQPVTTALSRGIRRRHGAYLISTLSSGMTPQSSGTKVWVID